MSDTPTVIGGEGGLQQQLMFMLGRIEAKLDALAAAGARQESDHNTLAQRTTAENAALSTKIENNHQVLLQRIDGDRSALSARVDSVEAKLETRITVVESDVYAGKVERRTMARIGGVMVVAVSALWGIATFLWPLFSH